MVNKEWNLIIAEFTLQLFATSQQIPTLTGHFKFTENEPSAKMRNYIPVCVYCIYHVYFCLCCLKNH